MPIGFVHRHLAWTSCKGRESKPEPKTGIGNRL